MYTSITSFRFCWKFLVNIYICPCRQSSKQRHHYLLKILRGSFEGGIELYEYIRTCSADERQTSIASCRYSHWLPKLHKNPYKSRFISNSSHCSTTILSKHIASALPAVKDHVIKYSETAFSNSNVNYFWSIKNSSGVIEKLRLRNFKGSQVSSLNFSTLYTSLPHDLVKTKVLSLVKWCFNRESKTYLCTSDRAGFFSNKKYDSYACWFFTELCESFTFLILNIYVQFDGMVYQQIVGIPMGTNCAPLIADLFLYCYERDFMSNLQKSKRFYLIDKFNDTSRYLDDIFTIDNPTFAEHIPDIYQGKCS